MGSFARHRLDAQRGSDEAMDTCRPAAEGGWATWPCGAPALGCDSDAGIAPSPARWVTLHVIPTGVLSRIVRVSGALLFICAGQVSADIEPLAGGFFELFVDEDMHTPGIVGSYVDQNLAWYEPHDDWRETQAIAGARIDAELDFTDSSWGKLKDLGLTGGSDRDWNTFSVQWDGYIHVLTPGTRLATISDDSNRMWIDIDHDGWFDSVGPEFINNHWGTPQAPTMGDSSIPLPVGIYAIRVQYEEAFFGNVLRLVSLADPTVRVGYLIPSNRALQPEAAAHLAHFLLLWHSMLCEQMDRNGFGFRSFRYETEDDGVTPRVHVVELSETDAYLREDIWGRVNQAAGNAGVPIWTPGEVWLLIPEIHLEQPSGTILGGVALGASFGSGNDPGVAMIGSDRLSLETLAGLTDDTLYAGMVVPDIGPYPLVQSVSFPWFEGSTFSSVVSSIEGATVHEAAHAFGIGHDFRNDGNFHGNIMGNGLRGLRGTIFPNLYEDDDSRLSYAAALALSVSRYFTPCSGAGGGASADDGAPLPGDTRRPPDLSDLPEPGRSAPQSDIGATGAVDPAWRTGVPSRSTAAAGIDAESPFHAGEGRPSGYSPPDDDNPRPFPTGFFTHRPNEEDAVAGGNDSPTIKILTFGAVTPVNGLLEIHFAAQDESGLAAALLRRNGDTIGEMPLSGPTVDAMFATPYYAVNETSQFTVSVYDGRGNRTDACTTITPLSGTNRAPQPFFTVAPSRARLGEDVWLDASGTTDPDDGSATLTVEWDLDGDGTFDTPPTTSKTLLTSFEDVGPRQIRVKVTDPAGAQSVSTPIALRIVLDQSADINRDGAVGALDFFVFRLCMTGPDESPSDGCQDADLDLDADVDMKDLMLFVNEFSGT